MSLPRTVSREEWTRAREALLEKEKEATRARDALCAERRRLPRVEVTEDYRFTGPEGEVTLLDLFDGRNQLIVGHFMFDPRWEKGCPSCTAGAEEVAEGLLQHLASRDTSFAYVSRAPIEKIERYKDEKGWSFCWVSSHGTHFNHDFGVPRPERAAGRLQLSHRRGARGAGRDDVQRCEVSHGVAGDLVLSAGR